MKKLVLYTCCLLPIMAQAQTEESEIGSISTDRPVQSETPYTVPKNHLQGEMGINYTKSFTQYYLDGPNLLLKYGLLDDLELRFTNNYISSHFKDNGKFKEVNSGMDMSTVGLKYKILHESENNANLVVSGSSKIDLFADDIYSYDELNLQLRLTTSKTISGSWYGIVGFEYGYNDASDDQMFYVIQTGTALANGLTGVIEYYGYFTSNSSQSAINGALVMLLNDNNQVDISGGYGLGDNFYDYYVQVGYSFRIGL